ncbi:MAG: YfhO family protein [Bacteroidetes bacterium]|nr:YfhO family protein [Bacteroidota bacterium]
MKNINFKQMLPYLAAIIIFLIVTFAYLSPMLEGKQLRQGDTVSWTGAAKEILDFRKAHPGEEPLWTNSMFGGMPAYMISILTPSNNVVSFFDRALNLFSLPNPANFIFLYFLGFFILLLVLKVDPWLSIIGALAFGFSSYFFVIIEAGHNTKAATIGYMAPVLAGIILTMRGKYLWGCFLTAIFLSINIKMNHVQMTYYLMILVLIYILFELYTKIKEKQLTMFIKASAVLIIAVFLALGTNITSLWTTYEYSKDTIRGTSELSSNPEVKTKGLDIDYATQWSYGIDEAFTLLIPDFKGGSSSGKLGESSEAYATLKQNNVPNIKEITSQMPLYWGAQPFTSGPVYAGAIFVFLFVLGLFIVKTPMKWVLLTATTLSIMLAWGKNFMPLTQFFFDYFPMYSKFRAVASILVIAELCIPLLGILALNQIITKKTEKADVLKYGKIALYICGGITLFFALIGSSFFDFKSATDAQLPYPEWLMNAIISDRKSIFTTDAWRSLLFIVLAAGLIWAFIENKIKKEIVIIAFILLVIIDMFPVDKRYFDNSNFTNKKNVETPFQATDADMMILEDKDPNYRVYNVTVNPFTDASTSYFHKSVGGYHAAKIRRYQDLIERHISKNNVKVLNMLNTRYFIVPDQNKQPQVQRNVAALGNAWFVENYKIVENPDSEISALSNFEPATTAIIDKRFNDYVKDYKPGKDSTSTILLSNYLPNHLTYQANAKKEELAVFSEIYYANGWNAYIDGKQQPYIRVNYVLRAMKIPQGEHKIEFKFEPKSYYTGEKIGYASSFILLLMLLGLCTKEVLAFNKKNKEAVK